MPYWKITWPFCVDIEVDKVIVEAERRRKGESDTKRDLYGSNNFFDTYAYYRTDWIIDFGIFRNKSNLWH